MKKTRLLPLMLAGMLMLFTGCDASDGRVDDNSGSSNHSNPVGDAVSDVGDAVSDVGEGLGDMASDLGDDVSDGLDGMTGDDDRRDETDRDNLADDNRDSSLADDGSVAAMEPVETEKKTNLT